MNRLLPILLLTISTFSIPALAGTYKCTAASINPEVLRYEVELSFEPISFGVDQFLKEEDGNWSKSSEKYADAEGILTLVKFPWSSAETSLVSNSNEIAFRWVKGKVAKGHLVLNLESKSGEFLATMQAGGTVSRRMTFSDCVAK